MDPSMLLRLACFTLVALQLTESTHFCPKTYKVELKKTETRHVNCQPWLSNGRRCPLTVTYYTKEEKTDSTACCVGWKGERCNIPICDPKCTNNKVCYGVNSCFCSHYYPNACVVRDTPKFLRCQLSIVVTSDGKERTVLIGECGQENLYSNYNVGAAFVVDWVTVFDPSEDIPPPNPSYVRSVKFGVVSSLGEGIVKDVSEWSSVS
ncbi:hypothetical protein LSAT2_030541 [Lamellibrachia satsuma]|nr:hypothetical protein LSAT2_030541 [Lamellibrachia satsuma]